MGLARLAKHGASSVAKRVIVSGLAGCLLLGCDIVQGFQSAGDTLFPEEATHLNSPGLRLLHGGYRELRFAAGGELYLLARSADDDQSSLYSMRYADPQPCSIPYVGRYTQSQEPTRRSALIAYLDAGARRGTLRFADTTCKSYDMELPDANLPVAETPRGFVVRTGNELRIVDPQRDTNELVADAVDQVIRDAFAGRHVVRTMGRLRIFGRDWRDVGVFGENVGGIGRLRQSLIIESGGGIARLAPLNGDANRVAQTSIAKDACALAIRSDTWATYHSPCEAGRLHAYNERTQKSFELDIEADARFVRLIPARGSPGDDPLRDPFWFFYLRDVDFASGLGTLVVRTPDGKDVEIGSNASITNVEVLELDDAVFGYALVDIVGDTGTLVWWAPDGGTRELAHRVLRDGRRLVVDYDGLTGNLAVTSGDRLKIVARGVPRDGFEYADGARRWTVLFHEFDGSNGKLSLLPGVLDTLASVPLTQPLPEVELEPIAEEIPYRGAALLNHVLPGVAYFSDYDAERGTGTLVYKNLELRFEALVNYGISDFIVAEDEIIYSIPYGDSKGIWVVQGK